MRWALGSTFAECESSVRCLNGYGVRAVPGMLDVAAESEGFFSRIQLKATCYTFFCKLLRPVVVLLSILV